MARWYRPWLPGLVLAALLAGLATWPGRDLPPFASAAAGHGVNVAASGEPTAQGAPSAPAPLPVVGESGGYSPSFTVGGMVNAPATYALAELQALTSQTLTTQYTDESGSREQHTYRGVPLYDLLMAASPQFASADASDSVNWYVHLTAIDNYQVVIAWGELDPQNEGKTILVAYAEDGQPLGQGAGMAQLVVPGDSTNSRYIQSITSITLSPSSR